MEYANDIVIVVVIGRHSERLNKPLLDFLASVVGLIMNLQEKNICVHHLE